MLANDARILIRSAVATAIVGVILIAVGSVTDGGKGALGAVFGVILVAAFFTASVVLVSFAGRWGLSAMMGTAIGTFAAKILILLGLIAAFRGTTLFNSRFFGITAIICILVWTGGEVFTVATSRIPYVVPAATPDAHGEGTVAENGHVSGES
jgi:ATP synthase protein I